MAATESPALTTTTTAAAPAAVRLDLEVTMTSTTARTPLGRQAFLKAARNLLVTDDMYALTAEGYEARKAARARGERVACAILRASSDLAWTAR